MKKTFLLVILIAVLGSLLFLRPACAQKAILSQVSESGTTKGDPKAPVTIIIYSDFECPACAMAGPYLDELLEKYKGKIYMIYRYYPLESHRNGFSSAVAAECAKEQGKFWEYHDLLFKKQTEWSNGLLPISLTDPSNKFSAYALELGLDAAKFNQCLSSEPAGQAVKRSRQEGDSLQVASTPTFFINAQRVVGTKSLKAVAEKMIQEALKKK